MRNYIIILGILSCSMLQGAEAQKAIVPSTPSSRELIFRDPTAEIASLMDETHKVFPTTVCLSSLNAEQKNMCNKLRETWYYCATLLTPGYLNQFPQDIIHNFSKCDLEVKTPSLFGLLGLDQNSDITHESLMFFKNTLDAAGKFKGNTDDIKSLPTLRLNFITMYTKLAAQHLPGLFTGITHEKFLSNLRSEKVHADSYEKMAKLLRQADYFIRNPYSFDLYQAFAHSPEMFKTLLEQYQTALASFNLDATKIQTIQDTLLALKAGEFSQEDVAASRAYTQLEEKHSALLSRAFAGPSRLVRSLAVRAWLRWQGDTEDSQ